MAANEPGDADRSRSAVVSTDSGLREYVVDGVVLRPPAPHARLKELMIGREPIRLAMASAGLRHTPRGDDRIVLTLPGYGVGDGSLAALRWFLSRRGHDAQGWGLGRNGVDGEGQLAAATELAVELAKRSGRPINLLGWSMGGTFAREIARDQPDAVHRVATLAAPLTGPLHTTVAARIETSELADIGRRLDERRPQFITRPILAVHSRNDGIVDWRACLDRESPDVRNHRVSSSHVGMGVDPTVWTLLADWFAADPPA